MIGYQDLKSFFKNQNFRMIIAADGETRTAVAKNGKVVQNSPAGGVSVALDPIARASNAIYIARAKNPLEKELAGARSKIEDGGDEYTLKRLVFSKNEVDSYYYGFSNQTLWPLCHVAFERPIFHRNWYEGFKKVNQKFAQSIKEEVKGKTFIWLQDYQLSLVPRYLGKQKNCILGMFWHIPWPTWEIFRILPYKKQILESMLQCDFLAFHRGYHVKNFLETVRREFETRIEEETGKIYLNGRVTTVKNLPLGVDTDVIKSLVDEGNRATTILKSVEKSVFKIGFNSNADDYLSGMKVILGVDRLDYTKGLRHRLQAIDRFFERYPQYIGKAIYLGLMAPSREVIPSYIILKKQVKAMAEEINRKYGTKDWMPIHLISEVFPRKEIINFYKRADVCLVTPLDDGMNLVSKEFVVASSFSKNPGMLVLSQFAGSAIDLTSALIVNPYSLDDVVVAIKRGLEMDKNEKVRKIKRMTEILDEKNAYEWAEDFVRNAISISRKS